MKSILITMATITVVITVIFTIKPSYWWLALNGSQAAEYSSKLLLSEKIETPEWAIDLVVVKESGVVVFGDHNSESIFAYSPNGKPTKNNIVWSHAWGAWYVGEIST